MAHSHGSSSDGMAMVMVFQTIPATPLFTLSWTPQTSAAYAGTCVFLIMLGVVARALSAVRSIMTQRALAAARARRYVIVADRSAEHPASERSSEDGQDKSVGKLISARGVEENVRVVTAAAGPPTMPWRFSVDLPRAAMLTLSAGVSYLLMLAVMTMNVGYFLSVLAGVFIGDLAVGRYGHSFDEH